MVKEYEIISHSKIRHLKLALNRMTYRGLHLHREFEIITVLQGNVVFVKNSEEFSCPENSIFIVNPYEAHSIHSQGEDCLLLIVQLSPDLFVQTYPKISNLIFAPKCLNKKDSPKIFEHIIELSNLFFSESSYYELECLALVHKFFALLLKENFHQFISEKEKKAKREKAKRLERILNYANQNFTEKISLSTLAVEEGLTVSYLSHLIKKTLNYSFQDYIAFLRLHQAEYLILNTQKRMLDISIESGFSDYRYMYEAFMKKHNCSPKDFKNKASASSLLKHKSSENSIEFIYNSRDSLFILKELCYNLISNKRGGSGMKCRRVPFEADVFKYELNKNLEDGFELWAEIVTKGCIVTDGLIKIKNDKGDVLCPYIVHRRGKTFIKENDYIIIDEDGTKHACGEDKIFKRYVPIEE